MNSNPKTRRRIFGAICIGVALAMLILGETVLQNRFTPLGFVIFWLTCLVLTALAIGAAFMDLVRVRMESREAQRELIEETIREVESEKLRRKGGDAEPGRSKN